MTTKFYTLLFGGFVIQSAVAIKNSLEQLKMNKPQIELLAKGGFVFGWAIVAFAIALNKKGGLGINLRSLLAFAGAGMIVAAVFHVKDSKKAGKKPMMALQMMFPAGWISIMMAIIFNKSQYACLSILGTAFVLGSMMFILPKQRELCIVDGPGYNLFSNAWWFLAIANGF